MLVSNLSPKATSVRFSLREIRRISGVTLPHAQALYARWTRAGLVTSHAALKRLAYYHRWADSPVVQWQAAHIPRTFDFQLSWEAM